MVAIKIHDLDTGETRTLKAWPDSSDAKASASRFLAGVLAEDHTASEVYYLAVDEPAEEL